MTASALLSALATYSSLPSRESASALGVLPRGDLGTSATSICSMTCDLRVSITETVLRLPLATNSRPSRASRRSFGFSWTLILRSTAEEETSTTAIESPPQLLTTGYPHHSAPGCIGVAACGFGNAPPQDLAVS